MANYEHCTLNDLLIATKDGDWGLDSPADGFTSYHVIRGADFPSARIGNISTIPIRYLSQQTATSKALKPGDIIIETAGGTKDRSTGRTLFVSESLLNRLGGPTTCASFARFLRIDSQKADPQFIYWYLQHLHQTGGMWQHQVQHTGVARFQYTRFASDHEIFLPSLREQANIAAVLGALEDKIAVNERIADASDKLANALLEEILLDDAEVSDVALAHVAMVNQRKVIPIPGGHLRYIDISSVSTGKIDWPDRIPWAEAPGRARRGAAPGDTIWSTVRPGRKSFALILDDDPEIVVSTGFAVLTPAKVGPAYLFEVTKRDEFVQYLESVAEGSAYPAVRAERFDRATIPLPSQAHLEHFESSAMGLRRRAHSAQQESRILSQLRDTLLPKLMSGEVRVRDAEKVVEEVT